MAPKLTIQLLGWNGAMHLQETAIALQEVPRDVAIIRYIDNGSTDASLEIIQDLLPHANILRLKKNIGFASAHNAGIAICTTPYVLTLDQDISIIWNGLEKLIDELDKNKKLGAVQGKLYRKISPPHMRGSERGSGSRILDSAGIVQTLALNGKERGSNEPDTGQYNTQENIFAVTGGCGMYRVEALKSVACQPASTAGHIKNLEIFDVNFFAYKEDVDLGWRLHK
ncbi:MAG: glycosyltransferase, partial [Patescibacteria group bacterium]